MSEEESIEISARDLMPNWLDDLDNPQKIAKKYADYDSDEGKRGRGKGGQRGGGARDNARGKPFGGGGGGRPSPYGGGAGGGRRPGGGGERDRDGRGRGRGPRQGGREGGRGRDRREEERRPAVPPRIEGIEVALLPEKSAIESIAKYVRTTGRAYPMWDIARTMLGARGRYRIGFRRSKEAGESAPELLRCSLDESLWLTREEALQHVVRSGLLSKYYRTEVVEVEPPKGNFAAIAVHRKSGVVLGPPNHHEYRANLMKLHQKRFSHVPFDRFSKEIEMRRDEETIEAWKESKTKVKHYVHVGLHEEAGEAGEAVAAEEGVEAPVEMPAEAPVEGEVDGDCRGREVAHETPERSEGKEQGVPSDEAGQTPPLQGEAAEEGVEAPVETPAEALAEGEVDGDCHGREVAHETPERSEGIEQGVPSDEAGQTPVAEEAPEVERLVFKTEEEVAKHFGETYGDVVFFPVNKLIVPGDIKGSQLSSGLLALLRGEVEAKQRAPMTLIQDLCRGLEKHGMKFFKEGKKMFVSAARPRGLEEGVVIADSPMRLLKFVEEHQGTTVMKMMAELVPGFEAPAKGESVKDHKPTAEEMQFVSDMRWLTSEGYLVEYSHGKVRLGGQKPGGGRARPGGKKGEKSAEAQKGGRGQKSEVSGESAGAVGQVVAQEDDGQTPPLQGDVETGAVAEEAPVVEEVTVSEDDGQTPLQEEGPETADKRDAGEA